MWTSPPPWKEMGVSDRRGGHYWWRLLQAPKGLGHRCTSAERVPLSTHVSLLCVRSHHPPSLVQPCSWTLNTIPSVKCSLTAALQQDSFPHSHNFSATTSKISVLPTPIFSPSLLHVLRELQWVPGRALRIEEMKRVGEKRGRSKNLWGPGSDFTFLRAGFSIWQKCPPASSSLVSSFCHGREGRRWP